MYTPHCLPNKAIWNVCDKSQSIFEIWSKITMHMSCNCVLYSRQKQIDAQMSLVHRIRYQCEVIGLFY